MDTIGPLEISLPEAVFMFLKQFGSLIGVDGVEERVAEYGDVSAGAVTAFQGLPTISERRLCFFTSNNQENYLCKSHSSIRVFVRRTGPGVIFNSRSHVNWIFLPSSPSEFQPCPVNVFSACVISLLRKGCPESKIKFPLATKSPARATFMWMVIALALLLEIIPYSSSDLIWQ